ncbi:hypothetical protein M2390_002951, partial [Mycetocola sp. BIGb0189]|uniref:hypothetical protein n=1 Tax=Mycetocola sp. BIGb0189 TaxID=2940604 RepID=UPI00216A703E
VDSPIANRCIGGSGFNYNGGRLMQGPVEDPAGFANAVAQSWRERGFAVSQKSYVEGDFNVFADMPGGGELSLKNNDENLWFRVTGTSGCYPGDSRDIGQNDLKELREKEASVSPSPSEGTE